MSAAFVALNRISQSNTPARSAPNRNNGNMPKPNKITRLVEAAYRGESGASDELLPL